MAWFDSDWTNRKKITVASAEVDTDLTAFPVFVDLADMVTDFHASVKSDGGDIRVTKADGTTEVAREIVAINTGTETGEVHFLADSVSSSTDTDFYMYYGNALASDHAVTATFGRDNVWGNYLLVSHDGGPTDSTGNGHQTVSSTGAGASVMVGATSREYAGSGEGIKITSQTYRTCQFWGRLHSAGASPYLMDGRTGHTNGYILVNTDRTISVGGGWSSLYRDGIVHASTISLDTWYLYHAKTSGDQTDDLRIGRRYTDGQGWDGELDEVRLSTNDLAVDWLEAEFTNMNTSTTFYTIGTQETETGGPPAGGLALLGVGL